MRHVLLAAMQELPQGMPFLQFFWACASPCAMTSAATIVAVRMRNRISAPAFEWSLPSAY